MKWPGQHAYFGHTHTYTYTMGQAHLFIIPQAFDQRLTPKNWRVDRIQMMSYLVACIVEIKTHSYDYSYCMDI